MLLVQVPQQHHPFAVEWLPEPSIGCAILPISLTEVVGCFLRSQLIRQASSASVETSPCAAVLYWWLCPLPSRVRHLALLCLFIILIFSILPIVGTCKISQTVSDSNHHLLKSLFGFYAHQSRYFSMLHIFLLLLHRCLCIFNSLSCPSGFSVNIILNPVLFLFIPWEVCCSSFLRRKLLFGSYAVQCPQGSDSFSLQAALAFIRLITSVGRPLCQFAKSAHRKLRKVLFRSVVQCSLCWCCCWARCWMLQDMDNIETSCIFYVKVSTFTHPEQSKTSLLTVNKSGIVRLTVQHDLIISSSFMYNPRDSLRQISADVLSLGQWPIWSWQSCYFGCCTLQLIPVNKQTTTDQHSAYLGAVGNPCNLQLCAAGFILSIMLMLAANYSILTWS